MHFRYPGRNHTFPRLAGRPTRGVGESDMAKGEGSDQIIDTLQVLALIPEDKKGVF
jgi:hypothetical protein